MAILMTADKWWVFTVRGLLAIAFGVVTIAMPAIALLGLVLAFGVYSIFEGSASIAASVTRTGREQYRWWVFLLSGLASVVAGVTAVVVPGITALALLLLIAARAIVTGVFEIVAAVRLRKELRGEWMLVVSGLLSIAFGVIAFAFPGLGALAVVTWIGAYALIFGALLVGLGMRLRRRREKRRYVSAADLGLAPT